MWHTGGVARGVLESIGAHQCWRACAGPPASPEVQLAGACVADSTGVLDSEHYRFA